MNKGHIAITKRVLAELQKIQQEVVSRELVIPTTIEIGKHNSHVEVRFKIGGDYNRQEVSFSSRFRQDVIDEMMRSLKRDIEEYHRPRVANADKFLRNH